MRKFILAAVEHFKGIVGGFALLGFSLVLWYCYSTIGRLPDGLSFSDVLHLTLIALCFGVLWLVLSFFLFINSIVLLKPVFFVLKKLSKGKTVPLWNAKLLISKHVSHYRDMETMEHVFYRSSDRWDFVIMLFIVAVGNGVIAYKIGFEALSNVWVASLLLGGIVAYIVIFLNRASRLERAIERRRYYSTPKGLEKWDRKLKEATLFWRLFSLLGMIYPVVLIGIGDELIELNMELSGYREGSADIYVKNEFCPVIIDRLGEPQGLSENAEGYCIYRSVEVVLQRIGNEVVVRAPGGGDGPVAFIPSDMISVQS